MAPWKGFEFDEYGGCVGILMSCIKKNVSQQKKLIQKKNVKGKEDEIWRTSEQVLIPLGMACRGFSWKIWGLATN